MAYAELVAKELNMHPLQQIKQSPPSLTGFIKHGGWFCERCQRVINLPLDTDEPARCPRCKKPTCKYHPPVKELQTV